MANIQTYIEVFGRTKQQTEKLGGTKGAAFLGKLVHYVGDKYEEMGEAWLDIVSPHCMLILGKRGTGKSYTLGVIAESFGMLEERYRERISVILVDTMSVYHSLKVPNINKFEVNRLKDFGNWQPRDFRDYVKIFVPRLTVERLKLDNHRIVYDKLLQLPLKEVDVYDWLTIFGLKATEPVGVLLTKVINDFKSARVNYGFDDLYMAIDNYRAAEPQTKQALKALFENIEKLGLFEKTGSSYEDLIKGGQLSVLDISYLGRMGGYDLRSLIIAIIARKLLGDRTLYTTVEMQSEAGLIDAAISKDIAKEHPLMFMLIDEAHLFLPARDMEKTLASDILIDWIKLGRHPGLSLILATQEPSALHDSAIRQADVILSHNLTALDDVAALSKAKQTFQTARTDISEIVSKMEFKRGLAVLMDDKTRSTQLVMVRPRLTLHTGVDASAIPLEELDRFESGQKKEEPKKTEPAHAAPQSQPEKIPEKQPVQASTQTREPIRVIRPRPV